MASKFIRVSIPDPSKPSELIEAMAWQRLHAFDHGKRRAAITWEFFRADAWTVPGAGPIKVEVYPIEPEEQPAVYGQPEQLSAYVPPVSGDPDPETGEPAVLAPAVEPTFGPAPLIRPRIPGYSEVFSTLAAEIEAMGARFAQMAADFFAGELVPDDEEP